MRIWGSQARPTENQWLGGVAAKSVWTHPPRGGDAGWSSTVWNREARSLRERGLIWPLREMIVQLEKPWLTVVFLILWRYSFLSSDLHNCWEACCGSNCHFLVGESFFLWQFEFSLWLRHCIILLSWTSMWISFYWFCFGLTVILQYEDPVFPPFWKILSSYFSHTVSLPVFLVGYPNQ